MLGALCVSLELLFAAISIGSLASGFMYPRAVHSIDSAYDATFEEYHAMGLAATGLVILVSMVNTIFVIPPMLLGAVRNARRRGALQREPWNRSSGDTIGEADRAEAGGHLHLYFMRRKRRLVVMPLFYLK